MYLLLSTGSGTAAAPTHAEAIVPATAPAEAAADEKAADIIAEAEFVQKILAEVEALEKRLEDTNAEKAAVSTSSESPAPPAQDDAAMRLLIESAVSTEARICELEQWKDTVVATEKNRAFVFIKPHAVTEAMVALVKEKLSGAGISIVSEGAIGHDKIDELQLVDNHYGAIASKAVQLKPRELNVPEKGKRAFAEAFGLTWEDALAKGMVFNAADACGHLGVDAAGLDKSGRPSSAGRT